MLKLLAIETSTQACSCALVCGDNHYQRHEIADRKHAELILKMVDEVLAEASVCLSTLHAVAFGRGPGSFTGVRIATGVIQGLAFGASLDVAPVSSLRALAQGVFRRYGHKRVLTALDARMAEVYWGGFESVGGVMAPCETEVVVPPNAVTCEAPPERIVGAGSGWLSYSAELQASLGFVPQAVFADLLPDALDVASIGKHMLERGETVSAEQALPVYLRDRVTAV